MTASAISMKSPGIDRLSLEDKLALIDEIWDAVCTDESAFKLTGAQRAELDRRIADADAHPEDSVPWEEVKASLEARCAR